MNFTTVLCISFSQTLFTRVLSLANVARRVHSSIHAPFGLHDSLFRALLMPPHSCIFCGRPIRRQLRGRPATAEQLKQAAAYHHPHPLIDTFICDEHRKRPLTTTSQKRERSPSLDSSHSSDFDPTPKRQRVAEILSSMSQLQQQLSASAAAESTSSLAHVTPVITTTPSSSPHSTTTTPSISHSHHDTSVLTEILDSSAATSSTPYLVYPFQQALANSQQPPSVGPTSSTSSSSNTVTTQQWEAYQNSLYRSVLFPQRRDTHMHHIVTESELETTVRTSTSGRYLRVFDAHTDQDIPSSGTANVIQELITTASESKQDDQKTKTATTSLSSARAQLLKSVLPFTNPTHTQQSYNQRTISPSNEARPVYRSTVIKSQSDAYTRLVEASVAATASPPDRNIFTPSISIDTINSPVVQQRLKGIAISVQQQYKQSTPHKHLELECDHVFTPPLDGFGIGGLQVYLKHGTGISWIHDELLWCSALNYMLKESKGCTLWIAIGLNDLKQTLSMMEIDDLFRRKNIMQVGKLLDTLIKSGTRIEYVFQKPGQFVSTPPGCGAAHLVISDGILITQLAWNYSFTMPGALECLAFWGERDESFGHLSLDNGSMATRVVVPLYTMEMNGYDLNLNDKIRYYENRIKQLKQSHPNTLIELHPNPLKPHCGKCLFRQDWLRINRQCIHCYFNK